MSKTANEQEVVTKTEETTKKPPLYKVLFHNDDYTTMEFVVFVLRSVFLHDELEAVRIMFAVHQQGIGIAGVFTHEVAEAKAAKVVALARDYEFPLLCTIEEE